MKRTLAVTGLVNATRADMEKAIRDFGIALRDPNAVGLFFYSGHGAQAEEQNFILPVDADIQDTDELRYKAVERGLAVVKVKVPESRIVYATDPGATAADGALYLDGAKLTELPAGAEARLDSIEVGEHSLELRYAAGEKETKAATVEKGRARRRRKSKTEIKTRAPVHELWLSSFAIVNSARDSHHLQSS